MEIGRPAKSLWVCRSWRERSAARVADTKLVAVIAPALTIGEFGLSLCSSSAITELNASPVGSAPTLRWHSRAPTCSIASAAVKTFEIDSSADRHVASHAEH